MEADKKPVALVTGASRGIGRKIALMLARKGYCLALNATNKKLLNEVKQEIEEAGGTAEIFPVDLLQSNNSPSELIKRVEYEFGQLDLLVNNAGIALSGTLDEITFEDYDRIMGINVKVPLFLSQAACPLLVKADNPAIINISSVVGTKSYKNQSLYAASKHALNGLMKALAKELQEKGIRVHIISPGGVGTEMILKTRPDLDEKQLIAPEEVAKVVDFLIDFNGNGSIDEIHIRRSNNIPFA